MFSWLFDRWSQTKAFTPEELTVLRILLPTDSKSADLLFNQAKHAPVVRRRVTNHGYECSIPYVMGDTFLIEADSRIDSPEIHLPTEAGDTLIFQTSILPGGFLSGLSVKRADGRPWRQGEWLQICHQQSLRVSPGWIPLQLSKDEIQSAWSELRLWCGASISPKQNRIRSLFRPAARASAELIRQCESRLDVAFPDEYQEFVQITNGFQIEDQCVLGLADVEFFDGNRDWLVISPYLDETIVAMDCRRDSPPNTCWRIAGDGPTKPLGTLKQHVCTLLEGDVQT